ncbi:MAG TPA: glutaredoxin family protein [Balneolaceae bacterium]|nr:glutaredoxin family protein [Balneolaceae bacterium]
MYISPYNCHFDATLMSLSPKLYGTSWCWLTNGFDNYLQTIGVKFERLDVEQDPDAEAIIRNLFNGDLKFPVLIIYDTVLKNPTLQELNRALNDAELL